MPDDWSGSDREFESDERVDLDTDELMQRGLPPIEDLPQDGAYSEDPPEEVVERFADAYRAALTKQREEQKRFEERKRRFEAGIRNRAVPATPRRLSVMLERVLASEDHKAVDLAARALALCAFLAVAAGNERLEFLRRILLVLSSAPYQTKGFDRDHLRYASILARRMHQEALGERAEGGR
ncbi:MAG TPA: hypothetical protein VGD77_06485 [Gemmatimonadaceae bacterium]